MDHTTFALSIAGVARVFRLTVRAVASPWQAWVAAAALHLVAGVHGLLDVGAGEPRSSCLLLASCAGGLFADERLARGPALTALWGLASLVYLTRPDAVLIVAPALLLWKTCRSAARARWPRARALGPPPRDGVDRRSPIMYYGFPFPNTVYAKLDTEMSQGQLWYQGVVYRHRPVDRDPVTPVAVGVRRS